MGFEYIVLTVIVITAISIVAGVLFRGRRQSIQDDNDEPVDYEDLAKLGCSVNYDVNEGEKHVRIRPQLTPVAGTYACMVPGGAATTATPGATHVTMAPVVFGAGTVVVTPAGAGAVPVNHTATVGGELFVGSLVPGAIVIPANAVIALPPGGVSMTLPAGGSLIVH